jgi:N-formylmaleamate deformylase
MAKALRTGRHVIANGIRLHYVRFGEGRPPLLVLPGITSPAATWEFVGEALALHNDVYIVDIRGRGLSQGGGDLGYRLDDYAADTAALIRTLQLERPAVLGHSMGGRIAIRFAARHPELVGKLVLVDPPVSGPGRRAYPVPLALYLDSLDAVSRGEGYAAMKQALQWEDDKLEARMEWLPTCDRTAIIESHASFQEEDIHGDLQKIAADTLFLYAEKGGTVLAEDALEISRAIGRCNTRRIDGAGHMIPWDRLDAFTAAVHDFVRA